MRTILLCLILAVSAAPVLGQVGVKRLTKADFVRLRDADTVASGKQLAGDEKRIVNIVNKGIDFGVSLGFSLALQKLYDAQLSPLDNTLQITTVGQPAFLLSTGVAFPLTGPGSQYRAGGSFYQRTEGAATTGTSYVVPYGLYGVATINLVDFNSAAAGKLFNRQLAGGLGLGYRINDNVLLALTFEMIAYRTPRNFLLENNRPNTRLTNSGGQPITTLSHDDDVYFMDRYVPSVSLKFFYLFPYKATN